MPRKVKPTRQQTEDLIRRTVDEIIEEMPFIRLGVRREIGEAMNDLRPSQSELYAHKLRP